MQDETQEEKKFIHHKVSEDQKEIPVMQGAHYKKIIYIRRKEPEAQEEIIKNLAGITADRNRPDWKSPELYKEMHAILDKTILDPCGSGYGGAKDGYIEYFLPDKDKMQIGFKQAENYALQYSQQDIDNDIEFSIGQGFFTDENDKTIKANIFGMHLRDKIPTDFKEVMSAKPNLSKQQFEEYVKLGKPTPEKMEAFHKRGTEIIQNCRVGAKSFETDDHGELMKTLMSYVSQVDMLFGKFFENVTIRYGSRSVMVVKEPGGPSVNIDYDPSNLKTMESFKALIRRTQDKYYAEVDRIQREKNKQKTEENRINGTSKRYYDVGKYRLKNDNEDSKGR